MSASRVTHRSMRRQRVRHRRPGNGWTPAFLNPFAWYDAHLGGSATQITDSSANGRAALTFGGGSNSPLWLQYAGTPYVYLPGVAGNYVSMPDSAALDITGDIDLRCRCSLSPWPVSSTTVLLGKSDGSTQRAYELLVLASGALRLQWDPGAGLIFKDSSATAPLSSGTVFWLRATLDVDNGAGGYDVRFFYSADSSSDPTTWVQIGSTVTAATPTTIKTTTSPLGVGALAGTFPMNGTVLRSIVRDGIDGTVVADFDASKCTQTGYTDTVGTAGGVWTVNRSTSGRKTVVLSPAASSAASEELVADDYADGPVAAIPPLTAGAACTLLAVYRPWATQVANDVILTTRSGTGAGVTVRAASATTVVADISDGTSTVTTPAVTITPGTRYVVGVVVPAAGGAYCVANTTAGSTVARTGGNETGGALRVFASSVPDNFSEIQGRTPYLAFDYAITAAQLAQLVAYHGG